MQKSLDDRIESIRDNLLETGSLDHIGNSISDFDGYADLFRQKVPRNKSLLNVKDILNKDGRDFVITAYDYLFDRRPAEEEIGPILEAIKVGTVTKEQQLLNMESSVEGIKQGVHLTGFSTIDLEYFYQFEGREFVRNAYRRILMRDADPDGENTYISMLRSHQVAPVEILYYLRTSEEGTKCAVTINGLEEAYRKQKKKNRLKKIPFIGKTLYRISNIQEIYRQLDQASLAIEKTSVIQELKISNLQEQINNKTLFYNRLIQDTINGFDLLIAKNKEFCQRTIEATSRELNEVFDNNINKTTSLIERQLEDVKRSVSEHIEFSDRELANIRAGLNASKMKSSILADPNTVGEYTQSYSKASDTEESSEYDVIDYFDFENHFRGSREHVKEVQRIYLPYFSEKKNVLDLGCGRGEFTELLLDHGIGVTGVDQYRPYVEYMQMKKLPVVYGDAIAYLSQQETVDGIFLGQVVEHISIEQIVEICKLAYDKLEEGNYLVMETPNPMSLAIFTQSFYIDPSHNKPVHPYTLKYLAEKAGFSSVEILFTESSKMPFSIPKLPEEDDSYTAFNQAMQGVSQMLYGSQDYAIIARK